MADNIKLRNGTAAAWDSADPTLLLGERGLETDTLLAKTGDGSTAWTGLPYDNYGLSAVKSLSYTILDDDANVFEVTTAASNRTLTLPTLADNPGRVIEFHKADSGAGVLIVDGEGAETINGAATIQLPSQYNRLIVRAGAATWHIMALLANYTTGWVDGGTDWTNKEFTVTHNLNRNLWDLQVDVFLADDASQTNVVNLTGASSDHDGANDYGYTLIPVSAAAFKWQTGILGITHILDSGAITIIDTNQRHYKINVYYSGL